MGASNAGEVGKIMILGECLAIGSMSAGVQSIIATIDRAVHRTNCHALVNLVYHGQH